MVASSKPISSPRSSALSTSSMSTEVDMFEVIALWNDLLDQTVDTVVNYFRELKSFCAISYTNDDDLSSWE